MKAPAFQWYAADYLADERVAQLSLEAEAVYVRLLSYCWREGSIPAKPEACVPLCKYADAKVIKPVLGLFTKVGAPPGRLFHKRLEEEREKQESFKAKQVINGKLGGRPKKANDNPDESQPKGLGFSGLTQTKPKKRSTSTSSTSSSKSKSNDLPHESPAPSPDLASPLKAEKPDEPRKGPAAVRPDEAAVFTIIGFREFVKGIGFGGVDTGYYLPLVQRAAEKTGEERPPSGAGKTWEDFVEWYFRSERKYNRLTYPVEQPGPNTDLQVGQRTTSTSYSAEAIAARNVIKY